jgi:hypothetical protein
MTTTRQPQYILAGCLLAFGIQAQAQPITGHYSAGIEGIRAASLPPQGLYFRDYNYFFHSDDLRYSPGPPDFKLNVYAQAPRVIWMTDWKPLGFNYGMDILAPFVYTSLRGGGTTDHKFGLGDVSVEPILLSRAFSQFDIALGYAFFAPTGEFDPNRAVSPGKGYWGHMLTLGGTYFFDKDKTIAISLLDRYEFNMEQQRTHLTPGQQNTLEGGLSLGVTKTIDIGLIGYYVQQTTDETGAGSSNVRDHVVAAGPEINVVWPSVGLITSLRYAYEIDAQNRPQGHTACLTLTYRF